MPAKDDIVQPQPEDSGFFAIIAAWPSIKDLAADLALPYETVSSWRRRGSIPEHHWMKVAAAAGIRGFHDITYMSCRAAADAKRERAAVNPPNPEIPPADFLRRKG